MKTIKQKHQKTSQTSLGLTWLDPLCHSFALARHGESVRHLVHQLVSRLVTVQSGRLSLVFFMRVLLQSLSRKLAELAVVTLAESKYRLGVAVWQGQGGSRPNA